MMQSSTWQTLFLWARRSQFVIAAIIFTLAALMPGDQITLKQPDKYLHVLGNFLLLSSAWTAFYKRIPLNSLFALLLPYSFLIEYAQSFTDTRTVDVDDMQANALGLGLAYSLCWGIERAIAWRQSRTSRDQNHP